MWVSGAQLQAAQALLDVTDTELAGRAQISVATIRHIALHDHYGTLLSREIDGLRRSLEKAGVEFIERGVRWRREVTEAQ